MSCPILQHDPRLASFEPMRQTYLCPFATNLQPPVGFRSAIDHHVASLMQFNAAGNIAELGTLNHI